MQIKMPLRHYLTLVTVTMIKLTNDSLCWRRGGVSGGGTPPLLMGVETCTATSGISVEVSQKTGNQSTSRLSNNTLGHIPKECT